MRIIRSRTRLSSMATRGLLACGAASFAIVNASAFPLAQESDFLVTICLGDNSPPISIPFGADPDDNQRRDPAKQTCHSGCSVIERKRNDRQTRRL